MKFTISSNKFKKIISLASHLCGNNLTLPILNNVLLNLKNNTLEISSTNLEIGLTILLPVKTEEEGIATVPGKILSDFVSSLPEGDLKIEEKDFQLNLRCKNFHAKILGQDPKDFPVIPQIEEKELIKIETANLVSGFSKVSHIVSPSDSRVEISGILMKAEKKNLKLVGTDSIRLAEKTLNLEEEVKKFAIIIPQKTAVEFNYIFSNENGLIGIALDPSQIAFRFEPQDHLEPKITLISRLIEGEYPEYEEIIPKETRILLNLDKEEFQKKIKVASLFSSRIQDVKLKIEPPKKVLISAASAEIGEATSIIEGKIEGEPLEISFNWRYLLDGLTVIDSSEILFGVNNSNLPAILKPVGDQTYLYVLMPKTI
ncbi:MAG TPA: DNA polymerase III subunit beta [Candidatus Pacearchaeota archaeon]|nr:DNA polymerase III subunit beta [Candidatus Pacearchaeota archaeon]HOK93982.1 DNA polymerase III subunit beta [Candidatus Pacearchaeota archaeon]HPO75053.1 DNA polymerase III subunit beta [Candidatus Pacearchaeota archaeon]